MATINLLPWREEKREQMRQEYIAVLGAVAVFAVLIVLVWQLLLSGSIDKQESRNSLLDSRIKELSAQVQEIADLKNQKQSLIERMDVIQSLQGDRPEIVHIFDELVRTLPDGVYYTEVNRRGDVMTIKGVAESNNRVSSLMRKLDASEWLAEPNLKVVTANRDFGDQANDFELTVRLVSPAEKTE